MMKMHSERNPRSFTRGERANPNGNPEFLPFRGLPAFWEGLKMHSERNPRSSAAGSFKKGKFLLLLLVAGLLASAFLSPSLVNSQLPPPPPPPPLPDPEVMREVMGEFFHVPVPTVKKLENDIPFPDLNLPVALFIAQQGRVSVSLLVTWRREGQSWLQIANRLKLSPALFFLPIPEGRVGPPYGRAYGYYWRHKKDKKVSILLSDQEIADLIHLRIASSYFGLPPSQIIALRAGGKRFSQIYGQEYRKRHGGKAVPHLGGEKGKPVEKGAPVKGKGRGKGAQ